MKINKILHISKPANFSSFKGKIIQFKPKNDDNKENNNVNPSYYQALNGITVQKPYKTGIKVAGEENELEIKAKDVKYFLDNNGKVDEAAIREFIRLYSFIKSELTNELHDEIEYYENLSHKDPNVVGLKIPREKLIDMMNNFESMQDMEKMAEVLLYQISLDSTENAKKEIAILNKQKDEIAFQAYTKAIRLIRLSRTNDGFEFSHMEEKSDLLEELDDYEISVNDTYNVDELIDIALKKAAKPSGELDIKFLEEILKLISIEQISHPLEYVIDMVKKYISKDIENKEEIMNAIRILNLTDYSMCPDETNFEELLDLCFDKNEKFDKARSTLLFRFIEYLLHWEVEMIMNNTMDDALFYQRYMEISKGIIKDYFENFVDKTDDIDSLDYKKFIDFKTKNTRIF